MIFYVILLSKQNKLLKEKIIKCLEKKNDSKTNQRSFFFKDYSYKSNDEFKKIRLNICEDRVYLLFFVFFSLILIFGIKIFSTSLQEPNFRNNQNYYNTIFKPLRSDIVDKDGVPVAKNVRVYHAAIKPNLIKNKKKIYSET